MSRLPGTRRDKLTRRLRRERPQASDAFVSRVSEMVSASPRSRSRRVAVAVVLTAGGLAALVAFGGIGNAAAVAEDSVKALRGAVALTSQPSLLASSPAADQYGEEPPCPPGFIGGINLGTLDNNLLFFSNGSQDANWQSSSKGYVGNVGVNGEVAKERTSGTIAYAGTIATNDTTLSAWQKIVNDNAGQAAAAFNQDALITGLTADLNAAFAQINALPVSPGFASRSTASLDGLNTQNGIAETIVINVTSGFQVSSQIDITGDAGDVFVLRWDTDANFANGYQGQVKFQSGGAIVPHGGLVPGNFIHVAGDISSSGGGSTPPPPYPQGPRLNDGQGPLINGAQDFSGGGFFTGYWLTTGDPANGETHSLSNGIFVGGWYSTTSKFSMTSGTSGVHVCPSPAALR